LGGSEVPLDEEIKNDVVDQLTWDNRVDAVEVELSIESYGTGAAGESLAGAVADALLVDSVIDSSEIDVSVVDGQMTLEGTVEAL
jgi:osmotically-inducible protein OsmY